MPVSSPMILQSTCSPTEWLPALHAHDEDAWAEFERWATPRIERYCGQLGLRSADIENARQQILLTVYCQLQTFRLEDGSAGFCRWLFCVVHNEVVELQRQRRPTPRDPCKLDRLPARQAAEVESDAGPSPWTARDRAAFSQVRAEFGETAWQAFWLVAAEEWPAAQAGAALGKSASAVRMVKCRICRRLRDLLEE